MSAAVLPRSVAFARGWSLNRRSTASSPSTKPKAQDLRSRAVEVGRGWRSETGRRGSRVAEARRKRNKVGGPTAKESQPRQIGCTFVSHDTLAHSRSPMKCRGGFLHHWLPCAPSAAASSEWPVGQRIFERGIPLLPRSTVCRGTDLVKYAVTKGTLTMASTAWMTIDLILKQFGRKQ